MQRSLFLPALRLSGALQLGSRTLATNTSRTIPAISRNYSSTNPSTSSPSDGLLPYRVGRSASKHLSVYHRIKSGGTNITTEVKKVEGNIQALAQQLEDELNLQTVINPRTNIVIIKGRHKDAVIEWLEQKGF